MHYTMARYREQVNSLKYRVYISDSLYAHAHGLKLESRYMDDIKKKQVDNRSGDEIAAEFIEKHGLKVVE